DALNALLRVPLFLKKSGAKNFGCRKMAKNYCAILSPANSPLVSFKSKSQRARTALALFLLRRKTDCYVIFFTPFFWGRPPHRLADHFLTEFILGKQSHSKYYKYEA